MPVTNVPTPGSPIRSNWATSVSNVANSGEGTVASKVAKAGDTMSGTLIVGGPGNPGTSASTGSALQTDGTVYARRERAVGLTIIGLYRGAAQAGAAGDGYIRFMNGPYGSDTQAGLISLATSSSVNYGTTSDRRLKDELGPIVDALERLGRLRPIRFAWKSDPEAGELDGFIADEVDPVVPGAVVGAPDAVDDDGNIVPQQLDPAKLVPILVAAVQTLADRVATLEAAR